MISNMKKERSSCIDKSVIYANNSVKAPRTHAGSDARARKRFAHLTDSYTCGNAICTCVSCPNASSCGGGAAVPLEIQAAIAQYCSPQVRGERACAWHGRILVGEDIFCKRKHQRKYAEYSTKDEQQDCAHATAKP